MAPVQCALLLMTTIKMAGVVALPENATAANQYEQTTFAQGPVSDDSFYQLSDVKVDAPPGTPLKVEAETNTTSYNLPPAVALSRIIYQSRSLNDSVVPASAYILWPHNPRLQPDGKHPVVAWAHGTNGFYSNAAPSHLKSFSQHWLAPYPLVLQGYVVVATDYAGLGVSKTGDNKDVVHEFMGNPAAANDVLFSVQAAQQAFPTLSTNFVVIGHSQGGGAVWGVAQHQATQPTPGYLGSIAVSPVTDLLKLPDTGNPLIPLLAAFAAPAIKALFPSFDPKSIFTDLGYQNYQLDQQADGCLATTIMLMTGYPAVKDDWRSNPTLQEFVDRTSNGGKPIGGPLLVIQGDSDPNINIDTTTDAVNRTRQAYPDATLQYAVLPGITHIGAMYAGQNLWLDWIRDRFAGASVPLGYQRIETPTPPRPLAAYQPDPNWIIKTADAPYELF